MEFLEDFDLASHLEVITLERATFTFC